MKQIIQDLRTGQTILEEIPAPQVRAGQVLIRSTRSLVSLGTERMLVEFGQANWLDKARQQPDKVKQVLQKMRTDGILPTVEAVFRKLGEPLPLGYCNVGEVLAVGAGVDKFRIGDRVASNGHHAEIVSVPQHLVAAIPDNVSDEEAAFTVIGAIALQGLRLAAPTFGETVVVTGLGLIGLITAQLLKANGCQVIGLDFDPEKVRLAESWGIETLIIQDGQDPVNFVETYTNGVGADSVIITASTPSHNVMHQAAQMSRKRGRIILIGVVGLDLQRADFFEKELTFQVSCSYGPGRYDEEYEQKGHDYPIGFVRWTEQRNFQAVLQALATGQLNVKPLITEVVDLENYQQIYGDMSAKGKIASILRYPGTASMDHRTIQVGSTLHSPPSTPHLGIIGAGNFTSAVIIPTLKKLKADIQVISSSKGLSGTTLAKKYGIPTSTTDTTSVLEDPQIGGVLITTRHNAHANQVVAALQAGKHVFVEKPLALTLEELDQINTAMASGSPSLLVGFNRRFSPAAQRLRRLLGSGPVNMTATMNAGAIPANHWTQDMAIGGGRIIGEACHMIDLLSFLADSEVSAVTMTALGPDPRENTDNAIILLQFRNGSQGSIQYVANGSKSYPKERVEVHSQGRTAVIDNFRKLTLFGFKGSGWSGQQDKGHTEQFRQWLQFLKTGGEPLIPFSSLLNSSRAAILAVSSVKDGTWKDV